MSQTTTPISHTPLSVKARRMDFPYQEMASRDFFDNNCLKSAYIAALSATFPAGEGEFIKSVRMFQHKTQDADLKEQIRGFIGQEAHHSLQHKRFNEALRDKGYDVPKLEKVFEKDLAWSIDKRSDEQRLAFTVCIEHMTAIMAYDFLTKPERLEGMDEAIRPLMLWHSVEELEHKSVAFDLYMEVVGDRELLHRSMKLARIILPYRFMKYTLILLRWSKKRPTWNEVKGFWKFAYGKDGMMSSLRKPLNEFFRKDFHPWDHDDSYLIDEWKAKEYNPDFDHTSKKKVA